MRDEHTHVATEEAAEAVAETTDEAGSSRASVPASSTATPQAPASSAGSRRALTPTHPDPTRYGDWEKAGRCIDF